jgi:hypothetical protein
MDMDAAETIRTAMARVAQLRAQCEADAGLALARSAVKQFQSRRFQGSYADMLAGGPYQQAARFFLDELYGDHDFAERDAQFSRIAKALQRVFPAQVVQTAVSLAQLHALSESLDFEMARQWRALDPKEWDDAVVRYARCWRAVGRRAERFEQVHTVLAIGQELDRLVRLPGLRMMLRMMRGPATMAGLSALQHFLETGFDTFAAMGGKKGQGAREFLATIRQRETALVECLFDDSVAAGAALLQQTLGKAR